MTWNETPNEKKLEILDQLQDGTKSPLQVLLDAGITPSDSWVKELSRANDLLQRIKTNLPLLEEWLAEIAGPYEEEDGVYRLYHQSYKVFDRIQPHTEKGFQLLTAIGPVTNQWYQEIYHEGTKYHSMAETWAETPEE